MATTDTKTQARVLSEAWAEVRQCQENALRDAKTIGRLNGKEEYQTLMRINNELAAARDKAVAERDTVIVLHDAMKTQMHTGEANLLAMRAERDELAAQLAAISPERCPHGQQIGTPCSHCYRFVARHPTLSVTTTGTTPQEDRDE